MQAEAHQKTVNTVLHFLLLNFNFIYTTIVQTEIKLNHNIKGNQYNIDGLNDTKKQIKNVAPSIICDISIDHFFETMLVQCRYPT
jgi:hypothetical protein